MITFVDQLIYWYTDHFSNEIRFNLITPNTLIVAWWWLIFRWQINSWSSFGNSNTYISHGLNRRWNTWNEISDSYSSWMSMCWSDPPSSLSITSTSAAVFLEHLYAIHPMTKTCLLRNNKYNWIEVHCGSTHIPLQQWWLYQLVTKIK